MTDIETPPDNSPAKPEYKLKIHEGVCLLPDHKFLLIEAQRSVVNTNYVHCEDAYKEVFNYLKRATKLIIPPSNDYTVVLSYFDETRCFDSLKAWIDSYKEICKSEGIIPQRVVAIVSDLSHLWSQFGWDTEITEYNGCDILYVNYSNKVYLSNKYNKMHIRSQAWEPDAEQILFLPGHMINLGHRMDLLEQLRDTFGTSKIKYTLNIPSPDDQGAWDSYKERRPKDIDFESWKDYLLKNATTIGDGEGVKFFKYQVMSGVDMPGEIYNNTIAQVLGPYNHLGLTEKLPRAILNDMPVFFPYHHHLNYQGYLHYEYHMHKISEIKDHIEDIRSKPHLTREMLDYNKNLLNTHGEEFYNYLDEHLSGKLEPLFLEGGLFSHAM